MRNGKQHNAHSHITHIHAATQIEHHRALDVTQPWQLFGVSCSGQPGSNWPKLLIMSFDIRLFTLSAIRNRVGFSYIHTYLQMADASVSPKPSHSFQPSSPCSLVFTQ